MAECAAICDANALCLAFEYGVDYGGDGEYEAGDCQEQSSAVLNGCDGAHHNLDLYVKDQSSFPLDDTTIREAVAAWLGCRATVARCRPVALRPRFVTEATATDATRRAVAEARAADYPEAGAWGLRAEVARYDEARGGFGSDGGVYDGWDFAASDERWSSPTGGARREGGVGAGLGSLRR